LDVLSAPYDHIFDRNIDAGFDDDVAVIQDAAKLC
jgi:hypothetical protein